jgi:hypothetical protein
LRCGRPRTSGTAARPRPRPPVANALKNAAPQPYPEFRQTIADLRTVHGQPAVTEALQRMQTTTTVPADWT